VLEHDGRQTPVQAQSAGTSFLRDWEAVSHKYLTANTPGPLREVEYNRCGSCRPPGQLHVTKTLAKCRFGVHALACLDAERHAKA
jgi:hypothetical protein